MSRPRLATLALAGLVAATVVMRPVAHGVPLPGIAAFWAVALGQVVLPGALLVRGARLAGAGDAWRTLGQGASLGLALQGIAFVAGRALGAPWLATLVAVLTGLAGLALLRRRRGAAGPDEALPSASPLTLAVMLLALLQQPIFSTARLGEPLPFDLLFHASTAGELRHRWPLQDPRVAGVPLRYHLLAYALPIEAADLAGAPLFDALLALAPLFWVGLLALQAQNAGRLLFRSPLAGALGAAVALFHADPGELLGLGPGAFNSHFATALYGSPTTACSLVLLAAILIALAGWLEAGRRRDLAVLLLLAAAASATKTTLLPVVLGGLALAAAFMLARARRLEAIRLAAAAGVVAAAGAPFTLWQTLSQSSYSNMAHFGIATAFTRSPFAALASAWLGAEEAWGTGSLPLFFVWLLGYLGLAAIASALWLGRPRAALSAPQAWALAAAATALVASLLVDAPGLSQLFLLYNGQLLLCLFAGAGLASLPALPPRRKRIVVPLLLLAALPPVVKLARAVPAIAAADAASASAIQSPGERDYAAGLAWLRQNASRGAVVFADNPSLLLSALGEVRLYYETGLYTARAWQVAEGQDPFPERTSLQVRVLRRPDAPGVAQARGEIGAGQRLVVAADSVQSRVDGGFVVFSIGRVPARRLFPPALYELRWANPMLHVYQAR